MRMSQDDGHEQQMRSTSVSAEFAEAIENYYSQGLNKKEKIRKNHHPTIQVMIMMTFLFLKVLTGNTGIQTPTTRSKVIQKIQRPILQKWIVTKN
jgi:hypothetical protein